MVAERLHAADQHAARPLGAPLWRPLQGDPGRAGTLLLGAARLYPSQPGAGGHCCRERWPRIICVEHFAPLSWAITQAATMVGNGDGFRGLRMRRYRQWTQGVSRLVGAAGRLAQSPPAGTTFQRAMASRSWRCIQVCGGDGSSVRSTSARNCLRCSPNGRAN